jgi:hypothetical protein
MFNVLRREDSEGGLESEEGFGGWGQGLCINQQVWLPTYPLGLYNHTSPFWSQPAMVPTDCNLIQR